MAVKRSPRPRATPPRARGARLAQRRRTRKAIVDATVALMAAGTTPSVNDVAAAAEVSRRTIYMYFPTFDQLLIDATVAALSQASVEGALQREPSTDVERRVEAMVRALSGVTPEVERLGRTLIRLTVESPSGPLAAGMPRRGYRRIEWIETALEPLRREVGNATFQRLVNALAMVVGWEALIVQRDVCGLSATEGEELSLWAAKAFIAAARANRRSV
jgi:AcrR family transcriptional regulator